MVGGKKTTAHNEAGQSKQQKNANRRLQADINAEVKRRVQKVRKARSNDGNKGTR